MTREEARKAAEVMTAYAEGKEIETSIKDKFKWYHFDTLNFNWEENDYRIKQEPTYRPFKDKEECWAEMQKHQPFGWMKNKKDGDLYCLACICDENNFVHFYEKSTFADGTPFGIKEE